jgi:hypothetical protein
MVFAVIELVLPVAALHESALGGRIRRFEILRVYLRTLSDRGLEHYSPGRSHWYLISPLLIAMSRLIIFA